MDPIRYDAYAALSTADRAYVLEQDHTIASIRGQGIPG